MKISLRLRKIEQYQKQIAGKTEHSKVDGGWSARCRLNKQRWESVMLNKDDPLLPTPPPLHLNIIGINLSDDAEH